MSTLLDHIPDQFGMRIGAEKFPLMVVVGLSYVCNAHCPNCPYTYTTLRKSYSDVPFMADDIFKKIARECGKYNAVIRISGGGEPMLNTHMVDLITYAKEVGAKIGLITNGSRFTKEALETLVRVGTDVIEFSVDAGDEKTYKIVRPGLSWDSVVKAVMYARKIITKTNSSTKLIASIINQINVDVEKAQKFWSVYVDNVQIRKYLTWGYNIDNSANSIPYLDPVQHIPCPWIFERINIDSRGDITICGEDIAFKYKFANIKSQTIEDIWRGPELENLRKLHLERRGNEHEACNLCPDWKYRSWKYNYWKLVK